MMRAYGISNPNVATFSKPDVTVATAWTTANSPVSIFTITGDVLINCAGVVTTAMTSTSATGTLALGQTGTAAAIIAATTVNGTNLHVAHQVWTGTTATTSILVMPSTSGWFIASSGNIILTIATNNMSAGGMNIYAMWYPLSVGASVV